MLRDCSQHPTASSEREPGGTYSRKEVCRLLKIDGRQLRSWERYELVPERREYTFSDLLALKELVRLHNENFSPLAMRAAIQTARKCLSDTPEAIPGIRLYDVRVYKEGRRVRVQVGKQRMEACSGQLLFDFAEKEITKILQLPPAQKNASAMAERVRNKLESDRWFERGLELEQTGAPFEEIVGAYKKASELDSGSAAALVNLGTVFFNGHAWADAEMHYKRALEIDPNYPLAHFNLGNLYDEWGDMPSAEYHYGEAIKLNPSYADAHYNLALLHQNRNDVMRAVRHWRAYLKLDSTSTWSHIARRELDKLEATTVVKGNRTAAKLANISDKA